MAQTKVNIEITKVNIEIKKLIKEYKLNCSIEEFQDKVEWSNISYCQTLSEDFIREFKNKLDLDYLLLKNKISPDFYNSLTYEKVSRFELMII